MRGLQTHDVFVALKIANSAGIKEEFQKMALKVTENSKIDERKIGLEFLMNILGNCADDKTEALIYDFLGNILEIAPGDIKVMNPLELIEKIKELQTVISIEEWKSFFQSVAQVLTK